jgi:hypothetical protein
MTITVNTRAYDLDATIDMNQNQYTGPSHSVSAKDLLTLKRSKSNATSTNPGFARTYAKFTRSVTISGKTYDIVAEGYISAPVGVAKADVDLIRDDLGDLLISSNGDNLAWKQDINQ